MPYKDYEQAKKRMRDLYYEKVHGIPVVLFHDTTSFLGVRSAVRDIAEKANLVFHNFEPCNGLGILVKTT